MLSVYIDWYHFQPKEYNSVTVPLWISFSFVMSVPHHLALVWFLGTLVETVLGGLLVGVIVKDKAEMPESD